MNIISDTDPNEMIVSQGFLPIIIEPVAQGTTNLSLHLVGPDTGSGPTLSGLPTEEDLEDLRFADIGLESLRRDGPLSLDDVKRELDLD